MSLTAGRSGHGSGAALVEERLVLELEQGQVDPRADGLDRGDELVAGLLALDEDLARVGGDVGVGEDPLAVDHDARAAGFAGALLGPGTDDVGVTHGRQDLTTDSRMIFSRVLSEVWSAEAVTHETRPTMDTIIRGIRVSLGSFIAETRMRLPIRIQPGRKTSGCTRLQRAVR